MSLRLTAVLFFLVPALLAGCAADGRDAPKPSGSDKTWDRPNPGGAGGN